MRLALPPAATTCPLTVIGGFLGAGKTTFLNGLLARARGRYAVLVNDFGAVNVDARLVRDHDGETLRLTNGCVCCSLGDAFLDTLMRVLAEDPPFDHVIIEASGVGDPWAIAEIALVEPGLVLDSVVVLADSERIAALLRDERVGDIVARQIRAADIVLLNKADLADESARLAARDAMLRLRPGIRTVETVRGEVPGGLIGLGACRPAGRTRWRAEEVAHAERFSHIAYRRQAWFDPERLPRTLAALPASLLRLKGICRVAGMARPQVVQMVGPRWSLADAPCGQEGGWAIELVGIGAAEIGTDGGLDAIALLLDEALASPPPGCPDLRRGAGRGDQPRTAR